MSRIGIVGAGLIGRAWSIVFARAGHDVALYDIDPAAAAASLKTIAGNLDDLAANGLIDDAASVLARIRPVATMAEAVAGVVHVQENGPETLAVKQQLFAALDTVAAPEAVLASSSSALRTSLFAEGLAGRARCLVAHPVNPPYLLPLVELSPAPWTAAEAVERTRALMEGAGQVPVVLRREIPGFLLNRLQGALLQEAFRLVDEGYASLEDIDKTIKDGLGLRWSFMGPFETIDLNAPGGIADYLRRYGPAYDEMAKTASGAPLPWSSELIARIAAERRASLPAAQLDERQAWRDRRLMALLVHKKTARERLGG
jgi:L-gulonate 3-dehydrogenase